MQLLVDNALHDEVGVVDSQVHIGQLHVESLPNGPWQVVVAIEERIFGMHGVGASHVLGSYGPSDVGNGLIGHWLRACEGECAEFILTTFAAKNRGVKHGAARLGCTCTSNATVPTLLAYIVTGEVALTSHDNLPRLLAPLPPMRAVVLEDQQPPLQNLHIDDNVLR